MSDIGQTEESRQAAAVLAEASELMRISTERSLTVRLTGSLAIRAHCPSQAALLPMLGRRPYRDIDLIEYSKQKRQIAALFEERGSVLDPAVRQAQECGQPDPAAGAGPGPDVRVNAVAPGPAGTGKLHADLSSAV